MTAYLRGLFGPTWIFCVSLILPADPPMYGQQAAADAARAADSVTMQALLEEVRQMRAALERFGLVVPRLQLAAQRLQSQHDRLDRMSRELQTLRGQIAQHAAERDRLATILKELESESGQSSDSSRRKEMEAIAKRMAGEMERQNSRMQQESSLEADLSLRLRQEEIKLRELSDQLDALERTMERRAGSGN